MERVAANASDARRVRSLIKEGADINKKDNEGLTALHHAVKSNKGREVKLLLQLGANVNESSNDGSAPLHLAATMNHLSVARSLLECGANINQTNNGGMGPLHYAAKSGKQKMIECFLSKNADVNARRSDNATPLYIALKYGHVDAVRYLLRAGATVGVDSADTRWPLLHIASKYGRVEVVTSLLRGADVNSTGGGSWGHLHIASKYGRLPVVKRLLQAGADVNLTMKYDWTPLYVASRNGEVDVVKCLIRKGSQVNARDIHGSTPLHGAVLNGHENVVKYLVKHGAEVNSVDRRGSTALHIATRNNRLTMLKYLSSNGGNIHATMENDWTPLYIASWNGQDSMVKYLLSSGARVDAPDINQYTPLHAATIKGHLDVAKSLFQAGAQVETVDRNMCTPLHFAARYCRLEVMKALLSRGASVNVVNRKTWTPLHIASYQGHLEVVKYLLREGAKLRVRDREGETPLHAAARDGLVQIVREMANGKASDYSGLMNVLDVRNTRGLTALHLATQQGHSSVVEALVQCGASVNIQTEEGITCLHTAIGLSNKKDKIVEDTKTLSQISKDFYQNQLSPEEALVFYLLEHGADINIEDRHEYKPLHYSEDKVVRQMILLRSSSTGIFHPIGGYRTPKSSVSRIVDRNGGELRLEDYDIVMTIPPGATGEGPYVVTLSVVRDTSGLNFRTDESLACYGIACDLSSNLRFSVPVSVKVPHAAVILNPTDIRPEVLWCPMGNRQAVSRVRSSPGTPPYCIVKKRKFNLVIDRCAEWFILLKLEQGNCRHFICTPYIPSIVRRGEEYMIKIHLHEDVEGAKERVQAQEDCLSFRKAHRSLLFKGELQSHDVTVACDRDGKLFQEKSLSVKNLRYRASSIAEFTIVPDNEGVWGELITLTIRQGSTHTASQAVSFLVKFLDDWEGIRSERDLPSSLQGLPLPGESTNTEILEIAGKVNVDQYYELGVALGLSIVELDKLEYQRFKNREQATIDMLKIWQGRQTSPEAFRILLDICTTTGSTVDILLDDLSSTDETGEVSDKILVALATKIKSDKFFEVGSMLGFSPTELQHIQHMTLKSRVDANVRMLNKWKSDQPVGKNAMRTLKRIWASVQSALKAEEIEEENRLVSNPKSDDPICGESGQALVSSNTEEGREAISSDFEEFRSIREAQVFRNEGGRPTNREISAVAMEVKRISDFWSLGSSLGFDAEAMIRYLGELPSHEAVQIARQLLNQWKHEAAEGERQENLEDILMEDNIVGRNSVWLDMADEAPSHVNSFIDIQRLSHEHNKDLSSALLGLRELSSSPKELSKCTLQMVQDWMENGGGRETLLVILQGLHLSSPAKKIAQGMKGHREFLDSFSFDVIDHRGGSVELDEGDIRVCIPAGALAEGAEDLVTLRVSVSESRLPMKEGEVLVSHVVQCLPADLKLFRPANVVVPHCITQQCLEGLTKLIKYTKSGSADYISRELVGRQREIEGITGDAVKLQVTCLNEFALCLDNIQGVRLGCLVFQPLQMPESRRPDLHLYVCHLMQRNETVIHKRETSLLKPYRRVGSTMMFSMEGTDEDLTLKCTIGHKSAKKQRIPYSVIQQQQFTKLSFQLDFRSDDRGADTVRLELIQGQSSLVEQSVKVTIDDKIEQPAVPTRLSIVDESGFNAVTDDILVKVARAIDSDRDMEALASNLRIPSSIVNEQTGKSPALRAVGYANILFSWQTTVELCDQMEMLRIALEEAKLIHIAHLVLPNENKVLRQSSVRRIRNRFTLPDS